MSSPFGDGALALMKDSTMAAVVSPAPRSRASSAMSLPGPLSRPGSVQSGLLAGRKSLPNIPHPLSRMGSRGALNVRGESRMGQNIPPGGGPPAGRVPPHDAGSGAFGPRGVYHYNSHDGNLPPLRPCSVAGALLPAENAAEKDWCGRSQASEEGPLGGRYSWTPEAMHHYGRNAASARPRRSADVTSRYDVSQLVQIIHEKVNSTNSGQYLRHLFNAHDPNQQGNVSREALLKILYDVCGYITNTQYSSLLQSMGLEGKPIINFDQFANHFKETTETSKEWVSPVQKLEIQPAPGHIEGDRRHDNPNRLITASFCFVAMKDKAKKMQLNLRAYLPSSCFSDDGVMIPPQLKDLTRGHGLHLTEDEMTKLWQRFDTENVGLVRTSQFLRTLGMDEHGEQRATSPKKVTIITTDPPYSPVSQEGITAPIDVRIDPADVYREDIEVATPPRTPVPTPPGQELPPTSPDLVVTFDTPKPTTRHVLKRRRATPHMERTMDCLFFKFEEPLHAFRKGCELFDFLGDGFISRIDFKHVLEEFGFPVAAIDLEHFFSRCGIRALHGQIPYNEFLSKYWNRTESGIVNRIVSNTFHRFNQGPLPGSGDRMTLSAEELEAKLVEFFHGDFMALLGACRRHDKYDLGVVKPGDFRSAVERLLGVALSDSQWETLKQEAEIDQDGLIPYPAFLDKFNISPGAWNQRRHNGMLVTKVRTTTSPPQVERLRQRARQLAEAGKTYEREDKSGRSLVELNELMKDVLRLKFHSLDKAFKKLDRKMTGRFHMHQLDEMLKECSVVLTRPELGRLWASMNVAADGLFNFSSFVRHFVQNKQGPPQVQGKLPMDDEGPEDPLALPEFVPIPQVGDDDRELIDRVRQMRRDQRALKKAAVKQSNHVSMATNRVTSNERSQLLDKIKAQVVQRWDTLKRVFRQMDQNGQAFIKQDQMRDVMDLLDFPLSGEDRNKLLQQFDKKGTGNFHYMDFMSTFTDSKYESSDKENRHPSQPHLMSNINTEKQFITQFSPIIPPPWARKLQRDWKVVRRSFQKADKGATGGLTVNQFKGALRKCGIAISGEDLYEILSEFDAKLLGKIQYEDFLNRILNFN